MSVKPKILYQGAVSSTNLGELIVPKYGILIHHWSGNLTRRDNSPMALKETASRLPLYNVHGAAASVVFHMVLAYLWLG